MSKSSTEQSNLKVCTKCGEAKPATTECFFRCVRLKDGLKSECKTCSAKDSRLRRIANPEKSLSYGRNWKEKNAARNHAITQQWRVTHQKHILDYSRQYAEDHREERCITEQRRQARMRALPNDLTLADWEAILAYYDHACAYCSKSWMDCKLTQEHVVPVCQGGGYTKANIVPACGGKGGCNHKKGGRTPEQAGMTLRKPPLVD